MWTLTAPRRPSPSSTRPESWSISGWKGRRTVEWAAEERKRENGRAKVSPGRMTLEGASVSWERS